MPVYENNKRFLSFNHHLRETFGEKVFKIALDGGFTCPNRDGTVALGGCTFCSSVGSGDFIQRRAEPIEVQFAAFKQMMHQKWSRGKYIAYFQAFTNTHAPVRVLRETFERALAEKNVVGLSIATRPDCLPDEVIAYLAELHQRTFLWVELGLQTIHDDTAQAFNRGYAFDVYLDRLTELRKHGIRVCTHVINGLPNETYAQMMETVRVISSLDVQGIKLHLLHLTKDTPMAALYGSGAFRLLERGEYVSLICDQLEILPPDMVIHRLTGDGGRDQLIGPMWSLKKWETLNAIDDELTRRDSFQGKFYSYSDKGCKL